MEHNVSSEWAKRVLRDLNRAQKDCSTDVGTDVGTDKVYTTTGLNSFRSIGFRRDFTPLEGDAVVQSYRASTKRLILRARRTIHGRTPAVYQAFSRAFSRVTTLHSKHNAPIFSMEF